MKVETAALLYLLNLDLLLELIKVCCNVSD
jgi:hypothetical protein